MTKCTQVTLFLNLQFNTNHLKNADLHSNRFSIFSNCSIIYIRILIKDHHSKGIWGPLTSGYVRVWPLTVIAVSLVRHE